MLQALCLAHVRLSWLSPQWCDCPEAPALCCGILLHLCGHFWNVRWQGADCTTPTGIMKMWGVPCTDNRFLEEYQGVVLLTDSAICAGPVEHTEAYRHTKGEGHQPQENPNNHRTYSQCALCALFWGFCHHHLTQTQHTGIITWHVARTRGQGHRVCFRRQVATPPPPPPNFKGGGPKPTHFGRYLDSWGWESGLAKGWEGLKICCDTTANFPQK